MRAFPRICALYLYFMVKSSTFLQCTTHILSSLIFISSQTGDDALDSDSDSDVDVYGRAERPASATDGRALTPPRYGLTPPITVPC